MYLLVNHTSRYIECNSVEEKNGNRYLIFDDFVNENKEVLKTYNEVWDGMKKEIKTINGSEYNFIQENDYGKEYMEIKFNSDDNFPLNKPLKFRAMTIIIRSAFEEDGKFYRQVFLDDTLYDLRI